MTRTTIGLLLLTGLALFVAISAIVFDFTPTHLRSEEHTSELQSR